MFFIYLHIHLFLCRFYFFLCFNLINFVSSYLLGTLIAHSAVHSVLFSTYETARMLGMYCVSPCVQAIEEEENKIWDREDSSPGLKSSNKYEKNNGSIVKKKIDSIVNSLNSSKKSSKNIGIIDPGPPPALESPLAQSNHDALNLAAETFVVLIAGKYYFQII
jgi:hypothetical protein